MDTPALPPVLIAAPVRDEVERIALSALQDEHPVAPFLLGELRRARLCSDLPPDTVSLNNWVTYRLDWGFPPESRMLVGPEDYRSPSIHLSVLSPLGAALLGLRVGARMPYYEIDGTLHVVTVDSLDPPLGLLSLLRLPPQSGAEGIAPKRFDDENSSR